MSNDLISFDSPPNLISFNDDEATTTSLSSRGSLNQTPKRVRTGNLLEHSPFQDHHTNEEATAGDQSSTTGSNHSPTASTSSCTNLDSSHDDLGVDANNQTLEATAASAALASNLVTPVLQHKMSIDDNASLSDMNLESLGILSDIFTRSDLDTTGNEETWLCSPEELRSTNQREPLSARKELQDMTNTSISRDMEKQKVVEWLKLDSDVDMRKLLVHLTDLCDRRTLNSSAKSAQQPEPFKQLDQLLSSQSSKPDEKPIKKEQPINILPVADQSQTANNINNETVIVSSLHSETRVDERVKPKVKQHIEKSPEPRKPDKITTRSLDFVDTRNNEAASLSVCSENSEVTPERKTTSWRKVSGKQDTDADSSFSSERQQNSAETLGETEMYEEAVKQAANAKYFILCKQVEDRRMKECVNRIIEIDRMSSKLLNEGKPLPSKLDLPAPPEIPVTLEDGPDALSLSDKDIYSAMITLVRNSVGKDWSHNKVSEYATQVIQRVTGRDIITEAIASKYATYKKKESSRPATPTTWKNIASSKQPGGPQVVQPSNPPSKTSSTNLSNRTSSVSRTNTITVKPAPSSNVVVNNPPSATTKRRPVMAYGSQRSLTASVVSSGSKSFQPQPLPSQHANFKNSSSSYQMKHKQSVSNISDISSISSGYASNNTSPNGNWSNMTTSSSMQQITAGKKINSSVHQSRVVVSTPRTSSQSSSKPAPVMMPPPSPRSSRPRVAQSPSMSRKSTSSAAYQDVSLTRKSFIPVPASASNTSVNKSHSVTRQLDVSPIRKSQIEDSSRVKGVRASSNGWWLNDPEIF